MDFRRLREAFIDACRILLLVILMVAIVVMIGVMVTLAVGIFKIIVIALVFLGILTFLNYKKPID